MGQDQAASSTSSATAAPAERITVDDFFRAEIRAGVVTRAEPFPEARKPAYKLWIDFGELGTQQSSAQITTLYRPEELVGRTVLAVTNFPPRRVAGFTSEVLVLGVPIEGTPDVVLIGPDRPVTPGARVS
jgi:tRNA-binding protein